MSSSVMELELGLGLGLPNSTTMEPFDNMNGCSKKRRLGKPSEKKSAAVSLFEDEAESDCDNGDGNGNGEVTSQYYNFKAKELVGWPPVKSSWTKGGTNNLSGESASYVKVTMEGVFIGRKIDLSVHNSYEDLFTTLDRMFPLKHQDGNMKSTNHHHHHHEVAYEDGDGDLMLVGDVPWENFVKSVRRIKIMG